jgi:hypothetical protein
MRFIRHFRLRVLSVALFVVLATAGVAAPAATKDVMPFSYTLAVTSVTATGTFTVRGATATIHVHMLKPPKPIVMTWLGRHDSGMLNGTAAAPFVFVGDAVFTDPTAPQCNKTFAITSSGSHPQALFALANARDPVVTHPGIYVKVGRFPMVVGAPAREDGTCGKIGKDWWETGHGRFAYPSIVKKKGFTVTETHPLEDLGDDESVEWSIQMKVRNIRYAPISCRIAKGC